MPRRWKAAPERAGTGAANGTGSQLTQEAQDARRSKPNAKQLIDKLVPYTGWIGVVLFMWGVWETIACVRGIGLLGSHPLRWVFWACVAFADLSVGFLLGFGLISKYALSKNQTALARGQAMREKLVKIQAPLGLVAIVMGVLYLVWLYVL